MVGGSRPDLRLSDSGKVMYGMGSTGTPWNSSTAPSAVPTSSSLSMRILSARSTQAGLQLASLSRWQVV